MRKMYHKDNQEKDLIFKKHLNKLADYFILKFTN